MKTHVVEVFENESLKAGVTQSQKAAPLTCFIFKYHNVVYSSYQVEASAIFSGHVWVNQQSIFFQQQLGTSGVDLKTTLSPEHMFCYIFIVIVITNLTFKDQNN